MTAPRRPLTPEQRERKNARLRAWRAENRDALRARARWRRDLTKPQTCDTKVTR